MVTWFENEVTIFKNQLTDTIHKQYTDFVSISKQLIQLGEYNNQITTHLKIAQDNLKKSTENLKAITQGIIPLKQKQRALQYEILSTKIANETLSLLQSASNHVENAFIYQSNSSNQENNETINLTNNDNSNNSQISDNEHNFFLFLDAAIELSMANATLLKLSDQNQPALFIPISNGYQKIASKYTKSLCDAFIYSIYHEKSEELSIISNSAILSGNISALYDTFSSEFIFPLQNSIAIPHNNIPNSIELLSPLVSFLMKPTNPLQFVYQNTPDCFDFMRGSFWPNISLFLRNKIIFPIGQIGTVKSCFDFWRQFQTACEQLSRSLETIQLIRNSENTKIIEEKMHLDIYVQLFSNQLFKNANQFFSDISQDNTNNSQNQKTPEIISKFILNLCQTLFSSDSYIPEMVRSFCSSYRKIIFSFCNKANEVEFDQMSLYLASIRLIIPHISEVLPEYCKNIGKLVEEELHQCEEEVEKKIVKELSSQCSSRVKTFMTIISRQNSNTPSSFVKEIFKPYKEWSQSPISYNMFNSQLFSRVFEEMMILFYNEAKSALENERKRQETIQMWQGTNSSTDKSSNDNNISLKETLKVNLVEFVKPALQMSVRYEEMKSYQDSLILLE